MSVEELAANYGSEDLLIAAIMRLRGCSKDEANDYYWLVYTDLDRLLQDDCE